MPFENTAALAALASIIPLIILYLLRPKPLELKIPSLMFLMRAQKKKKRFASLKKLIKDPIFLIQLLVLILLSTAAAAPFYNAEEDLSGEHTVFVIDASASMQVDDRFDSAVEIAKGYVSKKNTIILAQSIPVTVLEGAEAGPTTDALNGLGPKGDVADISSAITNGMRTISNEGGRIIVISDFTSWEGEDPVSAKRLAQSYGIDVTFIRVGRTADNVGIIQGWLEATESGYDYNCVLKNYGEVTKTITLSVLPENSGKALDLDLSVAAYSTKQIKLEGMGMGTTTISIKDTDSFSPDNTAYIYIPSGKQSDLLLITDGQKTPSSTALSLLPDVRLKTSEMVPADIDKYRMVVVATRERTLNSEEIAALDNFIDQGGKAVIMASDALDPANAELDLLQLLPVKTLGSGNESLSLEVVQDSRLTEDIQFDEIALYKYLNATLREDSVSLVETQNNIPMLAYWTRGKGTVMYVGFNDMLGEQPWNNFHNLPEYPVLWARLVAWMGGSGDISDYNLKTGAISVLSGEQEVTTPKGKVTTDRLLYDEVGLYEVAGKTIAVNLYDDKESDTGIDATAVMDRAASQDEPELVRGGTYLAKKYLDTYLIVLVILLVIMEIMIIRSRGEL